MGFTGFYGGVEEEAAVAGEVKDDEEEAAAGERERGSRGGVGAG